MGIKIDVVGDENVAEEYTHPGALFSTLMLPILLSRE